MLLAFVLSGAIVAGTTALWRTFRYDKENPVNAYIDSWPYWARKPITCGLCSTFWIALCYSFTIALDPSELIPFTFTHPAYIFFTKWILLGSFAAIELYVFVFFFDVSHYYAHQAHHHAQEEKQGL